MTEESANKAYTVTVTQRFRHPTNGPVCSCLYTELRSISMHDSSETTKTLQTQRRCYVRAKVMINKMYLFYPQVDTKSQILINEDMLNIRPSNWPGGQSVNLQFSQKLYLQIKPQHQHLHLSNLSNYMLTKEDLISRV